MSDSELRESGYVSRLQEFGYGLASPLYDAFVAFATLPLGGQRRWRAEVAGWLEAQPGDSILSLCCGTGTTDRAVLARVPDVKLTAIDLGQAQLARARRLDPSRRIDYRRSNAADTGLADASFDRIYLVGALHEMPRSQRARVLAEARRLCRPAGRVLIVEPCKTATRWSAFTRALFLFLWVPGNPEAATTHDLIEHGLATELAEAKFEVIARYTTDPDWFEGLLARPT